MLAVLGDFDISASEYSIQGRALRHTNTSFSIGCVRDCARIFSSVAYGALYCIVLLPEGYSRWNLVFKRISLKSDGFARDVIEQVRMSCFSLPGVSKNTAPRMTEFVPRMIRYHKNDNVPWIVQSRQYYMLSYILLCRHMIWYYMLLNFYTFDYILL